MKVWYKLQLSDSLWASVLNGVCFLPVLEVWLVHKHVCCEEHQVDQQPHEEGDGPNGPELPEGA